MRKITILILLIFNSFISSAYAEPTKKLSVLLNWGPSTTYAPLIIAKQKGYFAEQGLDVRLLAPTAPVSAAKMVAENKADIGMMYEPRFIQKLDQGQPIIRIGTLLDKPLNCIITLQQNGIESVTDLKGKRIGETDNPLTQAILTAMLKKQGLSRKDVIIVPLKNNLTQALLSHNVDAISGTMRNVEVAELEEAGEKVVVFFPEEHGTPNYSEIIFITNAANAKDPRLEKFLIAIKQAVRYLDEHPDKAWKKFAQEYPELNNPLNHELWFKTLPFFAENPAEINPDDWKKLADFMQQNHLIKKTQNGKEFIPLG